MRPQWIRLEHPLQCILLLLRNRITQLIRAMEYTAKEGKEKGAIYANTLHALTVCLFI